MEIEQPTIIGDEPIEEPPLPPPEVEQKYATFEPIIEENKQQE